MKKFGYVLLLPVALGLILTGCENVTNPVEPGSSADLSKPVGQKPGTWETLTPVPFVGFSGVEGMSVASVGNKIYAAFGNDAADRPTLRIYDIVSDTWSTGSDGPGASSEGAGIAVGGLFYSIGGRGAGYTANWAYDPTTDTWNSSMASLPTGRAGLAVAAVGNAIYAIGGRTGTGGPNSAGKLDVVERYDIDLDMWQTVATLPAPRSDLAAATIGGKIYVFGGFDAAGNVVADVDVYNPVTDSWSTAPADMPTARAGMYAAATKGGTVYVIGGWDGAFPFDTAVGSAVEAYKVSQDKWMTDLPSMPTARAETGAADHNGKIYILGGATPAFGNSVAANEAFKP